ncbi:MULTISPECIES: MerR family transcriptional regulator [unclassified Arthrobacter]|uniref:MerR family transcriptional regulator n=1 Tax=unclassified Arthrobacter TaxID=235627 RepID=UPI0014919B3E|nr:MULTISPECIES: MerR family transcriptional regulator [unclassified Arthrobacter]MBE0010128.1 MerR family transcriptional regulator [Arthrobacter sp. AET 35A]NOJ64089.1 MerR family transcriptional regulator [Arthrobacter sp. 147(2020)]
MMQIGELAERAQLSLRTIRHYDEVGLLHPSARTDGNFRIYSEDDYQRLMLIRQARALGFSLDEVADLLDALSRKRHADENASLRLDRFLEEARARREAMAVNLDRADSFIAAMTDRISSSP